MLADGSYDAIVFDAVALDDSATVIDLTVLAGPHKGEVVTVTAHRLGRDPLDLLGLPATLSVEGGQPSVALEG